MARINAALVAEHSTCEGAREEAAALHRESVSQQHLSIAGPPLHRPTHRCCHGTGVIDAIEAYRRSAGYRISNPGHQSNKGAGTQFVLSQISQD
jgi:hypothetical protein